MLPRIPEILAPAGGRAQFFAALNAGADAVYLGLKSFNARSRAENFTADDLRELVPLAHAHGMKVLVTLNILIKDAELEDLIATMSELEELEVDAIIVQDLGVAKIAREHFPRLRLHASTQMAVHNLAGVIKAKELGFRRVVLARELTALELKKIRAGIARDDVEIEAFCHGSLCYSYSGLCFFSGSEDARSGNRGECAYTCRVPYKIVSEEGQGFLFSMKDLDTSASLDLIVKAGIDTLKIEGRKKDAQYVSSTVRLYRQRLNELFGADTLREQAPKAAHSLIGGDSVAAIDNDLALSFQRQRTSFFVKGRYHENVIDLENPSHKGLLAGSITAVSGRHITITAACDLERFDGLRLIPGDQSLRDRYENKAAEFSLRDLAVKGKRVFSALAGTRVDIELPPEVPLPRAGDSLHKIRSADLKRRVEQLADAPPDYKMRSWRAVDTVVTATASETGVVVSAIVYKLGHEIARAQITVETRTADGTSDWRHDATQTFALFGDHGFQSQSVETQSDAAWFVPRSRLKELKKLVGASLAAQYDAFVLARKERALARLAKPTRVLQGLARSDRLFSVKTDRFETAHAAVKGPLPLDELVFEPKRSFLATLAPEALADELLALGATGVKVRLALPTVIRAWDEPLLERWVTVAKERGINRFELGNLGALDLLRSWGVLDAQTDLSSDFTLYSLNAATSTFWREQGLTTVALSVEDDRGNLASHAARLDDRARATLQAIIFKDTPLFIAEACSLTALHNGCPTAKVCGYRTLEIENPQGERFFVAHEACKSIVYGKEAFSLTHKQDDLLALGIGRMRLDFLTRAYSTEQVHAILAAAQSGRSVAGTHHANFDRALL